MNAIKIDTKEGPRIAVSRSEMVIVTEGEHWANICAANSMRARGRSELYSDQIELLDRLEEQGYTENNNAESAGTDSALANSQKEFN